MKPAIWLKEQDWLQWQKKLPKHDKDPNHFIRKLLSDAMPESLFEGLCVAATAGDAVCLQSKAGDRRCLLHAWSKDALTVPLNDVKAGRSLAAFWDATVKNATTHFHTDPPHWSMVIVLLVGKHFQLLKWNADSHTLTRHDAMDGYPKGYIPTLEKEVDRGMIWRILVELGKQADRLRTDGQAKKKDADNKDRTDYKGLASKKDMANKKQTRDATRFPDTHGLSRKKDHNIHAQPRLRYQDSGLMLANEGHLAKQTSNAIKQGPKKSSPDGVGQDMRSKSPPAAATEPRPFLQPQGNSQAKPKAEQDANLDGPQASRPHLFQSPKEAKAAQRVPASPVLQPAQSPRNQNHVIFPTTTPFDPVTFNTPLPQRPDRSPKKLGRDQDCAPSWSRHDAVLAEQEALRASFESRAGTVWPQQPTMQPRTRDSRARMRPGTMQMGHPWADHWGGRLL